jgi:CheY-specific phosphatase CheX
MSENPLPSLEQTREWLENSVLEVLGTMAHVVAFPNPSASPRSSVPTLFTSSVGFKGDANLTVCFYTPEHSAALLASKFLDMPESELDGAMIHDVLGEFANMAVGAVKSRFSDSGVRCVMTIPTVKDAASMPSNKNSESEQVLFEIGQDWVLADIKLA